MADDEPGYPTPEEAALAGYDAPSKARVVEVSVLGDQAIVLVDTEPSHPMRVVCERRADGL